MTSTHTQLTRAAASSSLFGTRQLLQPAMPAGVQSRTGLPVVSNRAFVSAWVARRSRLIAAARLARGA